MDNTAIREVTQELHQEHADFMGAGGDELHANLARALRLLPEDGVTWAVAHLEPTIFALANETLFLIALADESTARITSRPVNGKKVLVSLDWGEPLGKEAEAISREATWTFRYASQCDDELEPWQRIRGTATRTRDGGERLDRRERLARELARRAGWELPPIIED
jgi:hypothetical protein